ncbi:MAG: hypothetical protein QCI00_09520 [Candidatus Thermoplasmatota archaeon]|nr:hypothetical protein [Candidatus Thermoplasmatota archaeon]
MVSFENVVVDWCEKPSASPKIKDGWTLQFNCFSSTGISSMHSKGIFLQR